MDKENEMIPKVNRHNRRKMARHKKKVPGTKLVKEDPKTHYTDDSYKDKTKRVFKSGMQYVKDRLESAKAKFDLPERVDTLRRNFRSKVVIINRDGREREFLPDIPPQHKILVHRSVAKVMISKVCMLVRITASKDKEDKYIDGSWAITPAEYQMMNGTTIQHVRRRPWFFLRHYWYEISFDGRVQPASLFYDYDIPVLTERKSLWITREYVLVAKTDKFNDYFRFWRSKPSKKQ